MNDNPLSVVRGVVVPTDGQIKDIIEIPAKENRSPVLSINVVSSNGIEEEVRSIGEGTLKKMGAGVWMDTGRIRLVEGCWRTGGCFVTDVDAPINKNPQTKAKKEDNTSCKEDAGGTCITLVKTFVEEN